MCGLGTADGVTLTTHHVYHGRKFKQLSDKYGFVITLCSGCHKKLHSSRVIDKHVQQTMQRAYERTHTRDEFIGMMGRSWLTEEDDNEYKSNQFIYFSVSSAVKDIEALDKSKKV